MLLSVLLSTKTLLGWATNEFSCFPIPKSFTFKTKQAKPEWTGLITTAAHFLVPSSVLVAFQLLWYNSTVTNATYKIAFNLACSFRGLDFIMVEQKKKKIKSSQLGAKRNMGNGTSLLKSQSLAQWYFSSNKGTQSNPSQTVPSTRAKCSIIWAYAG